jgi:transposase-like protein
VTAKAEGGGDGLGTPTGVDQALLWRHEDLVTELKATNDSYRVDETYIKIKKQWYYLYRAVDCAGNTIDFMPSATRDVEAAGQFFRQTLRANHTIPPRVITVDKNAAYPAAFEVLQQERTLPATCLLRQCKYLNNVRVLTWIG